MKLAIQINGHPASSMAATTAYQFIKAALRKDHQVILVFFYYDGVFSRLVPAHTEAETAAAVAPPDWAALVSEYGLDLVICSAAAERRGLAALSPAAASDLMRTAAPVGAFRAGGLGQWVDACLRCDRFIVFAS